MSKNFDAFLELDAKEYANQYVVIIDKKVVANGKDIVSLLKDVRSKHPGKTPFVAKVPEESTMVL
jgi:hypothetical protein